METRIGRWLLFSVSALGSALLKGQRGQKYCSKMFAMLSLKNSSAVSLKLNIPF